MRTSKEQKFLKNFRNSNLFDIDDARENAGTLAIAYKISEKKLRLLIDEIENKIFDAENDKVTGEK